MESTNANRLGAWLLAPLLMLPIGYGIAQFASRVGQAELQAERSDWELRRHEMGYRSETMWRVCQYLRNRLAEADRDEYLRNLIAGGAEHRLSEVPGFHQEFLGSFEEPPSEPEYYMDRFPFIKVVRLSEEELLAVALCDPILPDSVLDVIRSVGDVERAKAEFHHRAIAHEIVKYEP